MALYYRVSLKDSSPPFVAVLGKAYQYFSGQAKEIIPFISINLEVDFALRIGIILLFLGIFIGVFGSMLSLRRISYEKL